MFENLIKYKKTWKLFSEWLEEYHDIRSDVVVGCKNTFFEFVIVDELDCVLIRNNDLIHSLIMDFLIQNEIIFEVEHDDECGYWAMQIREKEKKNHVCNLVKTFQKSREKGNELGFYLLEKKLENKKRIENKKLDKNTPVDTLCYVWNPKKRPENPYKRYSAEFEEGKMYFWDNGATSKTESKSTIWNHAEIIEEDKND